jgi:hypothetical protein
MSARNAASDEFIFEYQARGTPGLDKLADIVRGADTSRLDLAPQSGRPVRHLAGAQSRLPGRSRHAAPRHGDVRRALRVVPQPCGRDAPLAAEDRTVMSGDDLLILSRNDIARLMDAVFALSGGRATY